MRFKTLTLAAVLATCSAATAQAQYWGGTVVTTRPSIVTYGSPTIVAPSLGPVVASPYTVVAPTSRVVVGEPAYYPAPVVVPRPYPIVRPGWGPGYYGPVGPRVWGGRGWRRW